MYELTQEYLDDVYARARRHQGSWTGTAGALAADCWRLMEDRKRMQARIEELERELAKLRAIDKDGPLPDPEETERDDDVEPVMGRSGGMEAAWAGIKARHEAMHRRISAGEPLARAVYGEQPEAPAMRLIGVTGKAGAGKTTLASMIPGAAVMQYADPLYAALAAMLGIDESMLRHQAVKGRAIGWLGKSPRQLLQTLGTEWGRGTVREDVWLLLAERRIEAWREAGAPAVVLADVRFDNECDLIHRLGGEVWGVFRSQAPEDCHSSEAGVNPSLVDLWLPNTAGVEELRAAALDAYARKLAVPVT